MNSTNLGLNAIYKIQPYLIYIVMTTFIALLFLIVFKYIFFRGIKNG